MARASVEGVPWEEQRGKSHKKGSSSKASIKCGDGSEVTGRGNARLRGHLKFPDDFSIIKAVPPAIPTKSKYAYTFAYPNIHSGSQRKLHCHHSEQRRCD